MRDEGLGFRVRVQGVGGGGSVRASRAQPTEICTRFEEDTKEQLLGWGRSPMLDGPVDPSFRALSGRLKFTVRRHKFNKDSSFLTRASPQLQVFGSSGFREGERKNGSGQPRLM